MLGGVLVIVGALGVFVRLADEQFDFAIDYASAKAIQDGENPYVDASKLIERYIPDLPTNDSVPWPNWKPPFRFLIALPFAALSFETAATVWVAVNALALVLAMSLFVARLGRPWQLGFSLGCGSLALPVVQSDLSLGQVNGILLLLLVLTWLWLRDRPSASALALGTAIGVRIFPAFLLLPLVRRQRSAALIASTLGMAVVLNLAGASIIGPQRVVDFIETTWRGYSPYQSASFNVSLIAQVGIVAGIVAAVGMTLLAVNPPYQLSKDRFWAAVPLMLLAFPIVWEHYLVLALPWLVLAITRSWRVWLAVPTGLITIPAVGFGHAWLMTLGLVLAVTGEVFGSRWKSSVTIDDPSQSMCGPNEVAD